jgi:hypothetical protein
MMKQETIQAYTIDQHPDKEAVFDWIRDNWHDLGQYALEQFCDSLKALADAIDGKLDYYVGIFPYCGESIRITDYDVNKLNALKADDCPLTCFVYDFYVIQALREGNIENALSFLHDEGEYIYSDEGLEDLCEANQYYFTEDGAFHS